MQGDMVQSLIWEHPTCLRETKPRRHKYWGCALEPGAHNYGAQVPQILKPKHPRAHAPQQEKLLQKEDLTPQLESGPLLAATRENPIRSNEDPAQSKNK